jgi:hypothetical protein
MEAYSYVLNSELMCPTAPDYRFNTVTNIEIGEEDVVYIRDSSTVPLLVDPNSHPQDVLLAKTDRELLCRQRK